MGEKLEVYDLDGNMVGVQERVEFYREIKQEFAETGKITKKVRSIRLLLMNKEGRIYLQKRSNVKKENAGLYDKTVGGHVSAGHGWDLTVVRECAEELGFPATVLSSEEFDKAVATTDLSIVAIFKQVDLVQNFESVRVTPEGNFVQPLIDAFYIGYYSGSIRFADGESSGIEVFSLEELKKEISEHSEKFTEDIKHLVKKYETHLRPLGS